MAITPIPKGIPQELVAPKEAVKLQRASKPGAGRKLARLGTGGTTQTALTTSGGVAVYTNTFNINSFETDLFTGAGQAEIPIVVPHGAAGAAPKIFLRYSTDLAESVNSWNDQAQGPGLGGRSMSAATLSASQGCSSFRCSTTVSN